MLAADQHSGRLATAGDVARFRLQLPRQGRAPDMRRTAQALGDNDIKKTLRDHVADRAFLKRQHELGIDRVAKRGDISRQSSDFGLILE